MPGRTTRSETDNIAQSSPDDNDPKTKKVLDQSKTGEPMVTVEKLRRGPQIWGYQKERRLSALEKIFKDILEDEIGPNETTWEEVFRQGINGFEAISQLGEEDFHHLVSSMKKNKSPCCFEESKFFLHTLFQMKISLIGNWIEYQVTTGGDPTEDGWAAQSNPMKRAAARANYYSKQSSDKEPTDSMFPNPLKNIKYWNTFSESLEAYLQGKRGVTMVPLLCNQAKV